MTYTEWLYTTGKLDSPESLAEWGKLYSLEQSKPLGGTSKSLTGQGAQQAPAAPAAPAPESPAATQSAPAPAAVKEDATPIQVGTITPGVLNGQLSRYLVDWNNTNLPNLMRLENLSLLSAKQRRNLRKQGGWVADSDGQLYNTRGMSRSELRGLYKGSRLMAKNASRMTWNEMNNQEAPTTIELQYINTFNGTPNAAYFNYKKDLNGLPSKLNEAAAVPPASPATPAATPATPATPEVPATSATPPAAPNPNLLNFAYWNNLEVKPDQGMLAHEFLNKMFNTDKFTDRFTIDTLSAMASALAGGDIRNIKYHPITGKKLDKPSISGPTLYAALARIAHLNPNAFTFQDGKFNIEYEYDGNKYKHSFKNGGMIEVYKSGGKQDLALQQIQLLVVAYAKQVPEAVLAVNQIKQKASAGDLQSAQVYQAIQAVGLKMGIKIAKLGSKLDYVYNLTGRYKKGGCVKGEKGKKISATDKFKHKLIQCKLAGGDLENQFNSASKSIADRAVQSKPRYTKDSKGNIVKTTSRTDGYSRVTLRITAYPTVAGLAPKPNDTTYVVQRSYPYPSTVSFGTKNGSRMGMNGVALDAFLIHTNRFNQGK